MNKKLELSDYSFICIKQIFITKILNDLGNKSCSESYLNNEACSLNTSTIFSIFVDLNKGSV